MLATRLLPMLALLDDYQAGAFAYVPPANNVPTTDSLEWTPATNRLHYAAPENRLHYTQRPNRLHHTVK